MLNNLEEMQDFTKTQIAAATAKSEAFAKGLEKITIETTAFSKAQFETSSEVFKKLLGTKSLAEAIQIQTEYTKSSYDALLAQGKKVGEIFKGLAKEAFEPIEKAVPTALVPVKPVPAAVVKAPIA